jgi:uracil-DNA glycosylase
VSDPFAFTSGPRDAKILVVGEAWGREEASARLPFVGPSGFELRKMLMQAGILTSDVLFANVVDAQPPANEFSAFVHPTKQAKGVPVLKGLCAKPALSLGLAKLKALISVVKPQLIIGCGNVPLWALTQHAKLSSKAGCKLPAGVMTWRGSQLYTEVINAQQYPYLPIIHPAAILRDWSLRQVTVHDLKARAARFLTGKLSWTEPPLNSTYGTGAGAVLDQLNRWQRVADKVPLKLAVDIETYARQHITCIGFADEISELCVPFFYFGKEGKVINEFNLDEEVAIVIAIRKLLSSPNVCVVGQNYLYDYQWLLREFGIKAVVGFDTMLAHHLLFPGTPKSLDYLASLYCNSYVYWKEESEDWAGGDHVSLWRYNCKDVRATYNIAQELEQLLAKANLSDLYKFQLKQWKLSISMTNNGVAINIRDKARVRAELSAAAKQLEDWLINCVPLDTRYAATGRPWFTSPILTADIFYRQIGLKEVLHKVTKRPTTDASALETLAKKNPALRPMFDRLDQLRSINVFQSHFLDVKLGPDNKIRCSYNVAGTETFRWNSGSNAFGEGTNLQNIPKGEEDN